MLCIKMLQFVRIQNTTLLRTCLCNFKQLNFPVAIQLQDMGVLCVLLVTKCSKTRQDFKHSTSHPLELLLAENRKKLGVAKRRLLPLNGYHRLLTTVHQAPEAEVTVTSDAMDNKHQMIHLHLLPCTHNHQLPLTHHTKPSSTSLPPDLLQDETRKIGF